MININAVVKMVMFGVIIIAYIHLVLKDKFGQDLNVHAQSVLILMVECACNV
jgi:hypothetical protein